MAAKNLSQRDLKALTKAELVEVAERLFDKVHAIKTQAKEKALAAAEANADYMTAAVGAAAAGYMMGSVQKEIDAGTEGYSEENKKILGIPKDLALGLTCTGASYLDYFKPYKPYLRQGGIGAMSFFIGRSTFEYAAAADEETAA